MARTVAIGIQDFADIINNNYFYIDKSSFIKEWWEIQRIAGNLSGCVSVIC